MKTDALPKKVFSLVKKIPKGRVSTYKEIAKATGQQKLVRQVGQILKSNKNPINIPCHRIVRSDGMLGGYFGSGKENIKKKIKLLEEEGVEIVRGK